MLVGSDDDGGSGVGDDGGCYDDGGPLVGIDNDMEGHVVQGTQWGVGDTTGCWGQ